jgi:hypothetical protein
VWKSLACSIRQSVQQIVGQFHSAESTDHADCVPSIRRFALQR